MNISLKTTYHQRAVEDADRIVNSLKGGQVFLYQIFHWKNYKKKLYTFYFFDSKKLTLDASGFQLLLMQVLRKNIGQISY